MPQPSKDTSPDKLHVPVWPHVPDEVRIRLYCLWNCYKKNRAPDLEDIEWLAAYCED